MALQAGRRIDPALNPVPAEIVAAVRKFPCGVILVLIARLYFLLMRMAVRTEGLLMAGGTGQPLLARIEFMFRVEVCRLVA